jgi:hypothetical protein
VNLRQGVPHVYLTLCILHTSVVDCVWNVMAHAQKPDFRRKGRVHLNRRAGGGGVSSVDYWQPRCAHKR